MNGKVKATTAMALTLGAFILGSIANHVDSQPTLQDCSQSVTTQCYSHKVSNGYDIAVYHDAKGHQWFSGTAKRMA